MHAMTPAMKRRFKVAGLLGVCLLIIDTWLAFWSGHSIDFTTGCIYALISVGSGVLLVMAAYYWLTDWRFVGGVIAVMWIPVFCFNVWSQIGMHTSARMSDVQQASVQSEKRSDVEKEKGEIEAERLALVGARQALVEGKGVGSGWSSTRPVAAWQSDITTKEGDKVYQRSKQCSNVTIPESRKFCDELNELRANHAAAIKMEETDKRIAAADKGLASVRTRLANTNPGHSTAGNSSTIQAKILGLSLASNPNMTQTTVANEGTGIATAVILCLLAALLILADAFPHLMEAREAHRSYVPGSAPPRSFAATSQGSAQAFAPRSAAPALTAPVPYIINNTNTTDNDARSAAQAANDALNRLRLSLARAYA